MLFLNLLTLNSNLLPLNSAAQHKSWSDKTSVECLTGGRFFASFAVTYQNLGLTVPPWRTVAKTRQYLENAKSYQGGFHEASDPAVLARSS